MRCVCGGFDKLGVEAGLSFDVLGVVDVDEAVEVRHEWNSDLEGEIGTPHLTNLIEKRKSSARLAADSSTFYLWWCWVDTSRCERRQSG